MAILAPAYIASIHIFIEMASPAVSIVHSILETGINVEVDGSAKS